MGRDGLAVMASCLRSMDVAQVQPENSAPDTVERQKNAEDRVEDEVAASTLAQARYASKPDINQPTGQNQFSVID